METGIKYTINGIEHVYTKEIDGVYRFVSKTGNVELISKEMFKKMKDENKIEKVR
jgi:hypothetical protein